jgi:hypothetical protein
VYELRYHSIPQLKSPFILYHNRTLPNENLSQRSYVFSGDLALDAIQVSRSNVYGTYINEALVLPITKEKALWLYMLLAVL